MIAQLKTKARLVVAIDGYAGTGKTTIVNHLGLMNKDVLVVHLDDFIKHWRIRRRLINGSPNKPQVFEFEWYRYKELTGLLSAFKKNNTGVSKQKIYDFHKNDFKPQPKSYSLAKKILVVDGIFLLHPKHQMNQLFDFRVYLNTDFQKADKRRVAREKREFGDKFLAEDHPENWFRYFKQAYLNYIRVSQPQKLANLVVEV